MVLGDQLIVHVVLSVKLCLYRSSIVSAGWTPWTRNDKEEEHHGDKGKEKMAQAMSAANVITEQEIQVTWKHLGLLL